MSGGGMGDGYRVKTVSMGTLVEEFNAMVSSLTTQFDDLDRQMKDTNNHWMGPGGDEFRKLMVAYNKDAIDLKDVLKKISTQLDNQKNKYKQVHTQTQHVIADFQSKMQGAGS
jgi:WXG100 family type VII secretion target